MISEFKSDFYRMWCEKKGLLPIIILVVMTIFLTVFLKSDEQSYDFQNSLANMTSFLPLFLIPLNIFYFGDDFSYRTINHLVIKSSSRTHLFFQKVFSIALFTLLYLIIVYSLVFILTGQGNFGLLVSVFRYQLPYYLCILAISVLLFNFFDKVHESVLLYTLSAILLDNLLSYITMDLGENIQYFYMFLNLKTSIFETETTIWNTGLPIVLATFNLITAYLLFTKREFK